MAIDIKPDRNNWRQFCQEPPLTDEEYDEWGEMAKIAKADGIVFNFIFERTMDEYEVHRQASQIAGWSGLVASADAERQLKRAEIVAWKAWQARAGRRRERGTRW